MHDCQLRPSEVVQDGVPVLGDVVRKTPDGAVVDVQDVLRLEGPEGGLSCRWWRRCLFTVPRGGDGNQPWDQGRALRCSPAGKTRFPSLGSFYPASGACGLPSANKVWSTCLEAGVDGVVLDGSEGVGKVEAEVDVVVGRLRGGPEEVPLPLVGWRWVQCRIGWDPMGGLRAARSSTMMVLSTILIKASLSATERTPRWPLWDKPVFRGWSRTAAVVGWRKPSAHIWHLAPGVRTLGPSYASWQHWTKVLRRALEPGSAHALVRATRVLAVRMRLFVHRPCLAASTASFLAGPDPEMSEKFSRWTSFAATDEELAVWRHPPLASLIRGRWQSRG